MEIYSGTCYKKDGTSREMKFIKLSEMSKEILNTLVKGGEKQRTLKEGNELVWDIEKKGFRVFNFNKSPIIVIGEIDEKILFSKE